MNDFTKEELQCLLLTLDNVYIASRTVRQDELQEKIQSMIDNYCQDDPSASELIHPSKICDKCHQLVFGDYQCPCLLRGINNQQSKELKEIK